MTAADAETHSNTAVFIDEEVKTFAMKSRNIAKGLTVSVEQREKIHHSCCNIRLALVHFGYFDCILTRNNCRCYLSANNINARVYGLPVSQLVPLNFVGHLQV